MKVSKDHIAGFIVAVLLIAVVIAPIIWGLSIQKQLAEHAVRLLQVETAHNNLVQALTGGQPGGAPPGARRAPGTTPGAPTPVPAPSAAQPAPADKK